MITRFSKVALLIATLALLFGPRLAVDQQAHVSPASLTASVLAPTTGDEVAVAPARVAGHAEAPLYLALVAAGCALIALRRRRVDDAAPVPARHWRVGVLPNRRGPPARPV